MSQIDDDIAMVRNAAVGMPHIPSMTSAAFERIVAEMERLQGRVASLDEENLELRMGDDL